MLFTSSASGKLNLFFRTRRRAPSTDSSPSAFAIFGEAGNIVDLISTEAGGKVLT